MTRTPAAKLASLVALGTACVLSELPAAAQPLAYPAALDRESLISWLRRETDITPDQVIAVSPSAVTSIVSSSTLFSPPGLRVSVRAEAITPENAGRRGAVSWQTTADLDCVGRRIRVGATTGYPSRNLLGQPIAVSPGDNDWREPPNGTQLESIWRAFCDRSFVRPLTAGALAHTADEPVPAPKPSATVPPPQAARAAPQEPTPSPATARPPPKPRVIADVAVQVVGSSDRTEAARLARQLAARGEGLSSETAQASVNGRTIYRGLIRGFVSRAAAQAFCERLKASGQACFLR